MLPDLLFVSFREISDLGLVPAFFFAYMQTDDCVVQGNQEY